MAVLGWALRVDKLIDADDMVETVNNLGEEGAKLLRQALTVLRGSLDERAPVLVASCTESELLQIIALGPDMATAAAESDDVLQFVKNELQYVDLRTLLAE